MEDMLSSRRNAQPNGTPYVTDLGGGVIVPKGRSDWNNERSSLGILERASGQQFY